jgi:hypothetical protein
MHCLNGAGHVSLFKPLDYDAEHDRAADVVHRNQEGGAKPLVIGSEQISDDVAVLRSIYSNRS